MTQHSVIVLRCANCNEPVGDTDGKMIPVRCCPCYLKAKLVASIAAKSGFSVIKTYPGHVHPG